MEEVFLYILFKINLKKIINKYIFIFGTNIIADLTLVL